MREGYIKLLINRNYCKWIKIENPFILKTLLKSRSPVLSTHLRSVNFSMNSFSLVVTPIKYKLLETSQCGNPLESYKEKLIIHGFWEVCCLLLEAKINIYSNLSSMIMTGELMINYLLSKIVVEILITLFQWKEKSRSWTPINLTS